MPTSFQKRLPSLPIIFISLFIAVIGIGCGGGGAGSAPATYSVGGMASGLINTGLVLQNNSGDDLSVSADGSFTFTTQLATNADYAVTVFTQPVDQTCSATTASGKVASSNITSVTVTCTADNQDVSGLYTGSGAATFTGVNGGAEMTLTKVKGISNGTRFLIFNNDNTSFDLNVLIDGQVTAINKTDFSGTANIYQGGKIVATGVAVTGYVASRSKLQLSFAASASGNFSGGSIDTTFNTEYDKPATKAIIDTDLTQDFAEAVLGDDNVYTAIPDMKATNFKFDIDADIYRSTIRNSGLTEVCTEAGAVAIPDASVNIYALSGAVDIVLVCTDLANTTGYTGFASVLDGTNSDDTLWYAVANGTYSIYAVLVR